MPRYAKKLYQVGDFWLSQRGAAFYRTWYDNDNRQTRRVSLGVASLDEAKAKLHKWYLENQRGRERGEDATLKDVFAVWMNEHGKNLRSADSYAILLRRWTEFYGEDAKVSDLKDIHRQEDFQRWLFDRGLASNSVNRVQEAGRTAINRAWKRGMVENKPFIHCIPIERIKPKGRPLSVEEISQLYTHAADHVRLFLILMLGTAARNEAITSLTWPQIDFDAGLVHLNPPGRKQTTKRRPSVKLVPFVREVLEPMEKSTPRVIMFRGQKVAECMRGMRRAVARAGLEGDVSAYSCRHTVARWMRREGVSPWEAACQLGHKMPGYSMTELYAADSPDYLENAARAIDKLLRASIPLDAPRIASGR